MPHDLQAELAALRRNIELADTSIAKRMAAAYGHAESVAKRAEPMNSRARFFGRSTTAWTKRAEANFRVAYHRALLREAGSLRALVARRTRLVAAEGRLRDRLRLNEPWESRHRVYAGEVVRLLAGDMTGWLNRPTPW